MASITDFDQFAQALVARGEPYIFNTNSTTTVQSSRLNDTWVVMRPVGAAPTTAVVPTNTTAGGIQHQNGGSGQLWVLGGNTTMGSTGGTVEDWQGLAVVVDRLSHQGGLSGNVIGAQTTNLPTAALTRYTSGEGVMLGLSIYTIVGSGGVDATAVYTNSAGTGSRVTSVVEFGNQNRQGGRMVLLPLQAGDTGVRSVQSVSLSGATGLAGNFGVVLFKPLYFVFRGSRSSGDFVTGYTGGGIPEVLENACVNVLYYMYAAGNVVMTVTGTLLVSEA